MRLQEDPSTQRYSGAEAKLELYRSNRLGSELYLQFKSFFSASEIKTNQVFRDILKRSKIAMKRKHSTFLGVNLNLEALFLKRSFGNKTRVLCGFIPK